MLNSKKVFVLISVICLALTIVHCYDTSLKFLPGFILLYSATLGAIYHYFFKDIFHNINWKNLHYEDLSYLLTPVFSSWLVNILVSIDFLTTSFMNIVVLFTYFISNFVFAFLIFGILELFKLTTSELGSNSKKKEYSEYDNMNETQLQAHLNNNIKNEDYIEVKKIQEILERKFPNS